jgi:3-oxoadipate enol-lactonase
MAENPPYSTTSSKGNDMSTDGNVISPAPPEIEQVVVLLHSIGTDRGMWQGIRPLLESRYSLVTPDSRGHGSNADLGNIDVSAWIEDITAIVEAHSEADVHLVGLSMGGVQALASAAALGSRVKSLTLANTFAALSPELANKKVGEMRAQIEEIGMAEYATAYLHGTLVTPVDEGSYQSLHRSIASVAPERYMESAESTFLVDLTGELAGISVPTLIITSDLDHKTPRSLSEQLKAGIPGATLVSIPDAGHLSSVEKPAEFAVVLDSFLKTTQN